MFVRWKKYKRKNGTAYYAQLVQSCRIDGKPRQSVVEHLGTVGDVPTKEEAAKVWRKTKDACIGMDLTGEQRESVQQKIQQKIKEPRPVLGLQWRIKANGSNEAYVSSEDWVGFVRMVRVLGSITPYIAHSKRPEEWHHRKFWTQTHKKLASAPRHLIEVRVRIEQEIEAKVPCSDIQSIQSWLLRKERALGDLGLPASATLIDAKKSYRQLAHKFHPDKGGSQKAFQHFQSAWQILKDHL